jgi:hypothetical protein
MTRGNGGTDQDHRAIWSRATKDATRVCVRFSDAAAVELRDFVSQCSEQGEVEDITVNPTAFARMARDLTAFRERADRGERLVVIEPEAPLGPRETQIRHWVMANVLGETLVQNAEGNRLIHMWDRDPTRRKSDGARYHQTREGGDLHTDNVNIPEHWQYLTMGCIQPATVGGWSVFVSGLVVHNHLLEHEPRALDILQQDYWWEYRGIKDDLYRAPILTLDGEGHPLFRYLRTYLESAHRKAAAPMSDAQFWAINVLDAVLDIPHLRLIHKLGAGDLVIVNDAQIFHARTNFSDPPEAVSLDERMEGKDGPLRRILDRTWVKARSP